MLPPAMVFPFEDTDSGAVPLVGAACLRGWSFRETTGTDPAALRIYDGDETAGVIVATITLSANESTRDYPPGLGLQIRTYANVVVDAGSLEGSLWLSPISEADDMAFAFGETGPFFVRPGV